MLSSKNNSLLILGDLDPRLLSALPSVSGSVDSDLFVIANLEGVVAENLSAYPKTGKPRCASPSSLSALSLLGINAVCLANNHMIDFGPAGIGGTCAELEKLSVGWFGVGRTVIDAMKPLFVNIGKCRLALIGIAQNEFGRPDCSGLGVAVYNERDSLAAIRLAIDQGADRVIVLFHAGVEYVPLPSPSQRLRCQFLIDAGADAVICQHSHIAGPIEEYKSGWISYGTGDFLAKTGHGVISSSRLPSYGIRVRFRGDDNQMSREIEPLRRVEGGSGIHSFLTGDEKSEAQLEFDRLNSIIRDDQRYVYEWSLVLKTAGQNKLRQLLINKRWLRRFFNRFPALDPGINQQRGIEILNLIRAEAHRDVLIDKLESMWFEKS